MTIYKPWVVLIARILICFSSLVLLSACSTLSTVPARHAIAVNNDGRPLNVHSLNADYNFVEHFGSITNQIARSDKTNILIFVHGGLNTLDGALVRSAALYADISDAGYYPIFINWDSNFYSSYWEQLVWIRRGKAEPVWGPITSPAYLLGDLCAAFVRAPVGWFHMIELDWKGLHPVKIPYTTNCPSAYGLLHPEIQSVNALTCEWRAEHHTNANSIAISLGYHSGNGWPRNMVTISTYWLSLPFKLLTAPLLDFAGKRAWDNMLRRTKTMFRSPKEFDLRHARTDPATFRRAAHDAIHSPPTGGTSLLMEHISALVTDHPGKYQITLIGHSMGTIVLNQMICSYPDLPYSNIVYMAAACTIQDFADSVIPYLGRDGNQTRFYNLCLHPQNDATCVHTRRMGSQP